MRHTPRLDYGEALAQPTRLEATYARIDSKTWGVRATMKLEPGDVVWVWNKARCQWQTRTIDEIKHTDGVYWLATVRPE